MRAALCLFTVGLAVVATTLTTAGQSANLERGKYLVEQVPPMPAYMMQAEDADAIAAYLKSLP